MKLFNKSKVDSYEVVVDSDICKIAPKTFLKFNDRFFKEVKAQIKNIKNLKIIDNKDSLTDKFKKLLGK